MWDATDLVLHKIIISINALLMLFQNYFNTHLLPYLHLQEPADSSGHGTTPAAGRGSFAAGAEQTVSGE